MLLTILGLLLFLWLIGVLGNFTLGGFIHLLLVLSVVVLTVRLIQGKSVI